MAHDILFSSNVNLLRKLTALVLIVLLLMSYPLWLTDRSFPFAPVFYSLPNLPFWFGYFALGLFLVLLLFVSFLKKATVPIFIFLTLFFLYVLFDYNRIQVYYIQFAIMLGGLGIAEYFQSKNDKNIESDEMLNGIRLLFIFCYFYSGLYKANPSFYQSVIPWFIEPFSKPFGISVIPTWVGVSVALFELFGGIFLAINPLRRIGVVMVVFIHLFILACIGPFGHNWNLITWPWNVFMALFSIMLFWNFKGNVIGKLYPSVSTQFKITLFVFAGLLPLLFAKGKYDSFFSFDLYSGKTKLGVIYLSEPQIELLPPAVKPYLISHPSKGQRKYLDLSLWGFGEMRTLPYPEDRAFHKMHKDFSQRYFKQNKVGELVIYSHYSVWKAKQAIEDN